MPSWMMIMGLIAIAGVPYLLWTRYEARRHARFAVAAAAADSLGDEVIPLSLHPEVDPAVCIGSGACIRACPEKDILAIVNGRARLVNPLSCIGHSACMSACPVGAIKLVYGSASRGIELPRLSETFETNQPGIYVVGELSGMGLIRNAVEQGRQAANAIAKSRRRGGAGELDAIVVGAGPAGIASALGLRAHGLNVRLVDQTGFGGSIVHYPRAKVVMTGAFELPGYGTVRKKTMSKEDLLELWRDIRARTHVEIDEGVRVEGIAADRELWRVLGANGYAKRAANIILALGRRGAPNALGVPGEDLPNVAYRLLEPEVFAGKRVLVVGGGNAAAETAIVLAESRVCRSVAISYRRPELARLRSSVRDQIDRMLRDRTVVAHLSTNVIGIAPDHVRIRRDDGTEYDLGNDEVIIQIGGRPPSELLRTIGVELVEKRGAA